MFDESHSGALVAVGPVGPEWQPILCASNQVVLYNPTSHALSIRPSTQQSSHSHLCPYCSRPLQADSGASDRQDRVANYFQLLEVSNETYSRPCTPPPATSDPDNAQGPFGLGSMAQGYFNAFFEEECRLGMGANGSVYLCQHVLDGNRLGHFAVKKIAVGESHAYLWNILREVRLLESLHHPNIITYHHAWLETCKFSVFGPKVPALHVLMQWAEGGSLDDFIDARLGNSTHALHLPDSSERHTDNTTSVSDDSRTRSARIRAFRTQQQGKRDNKSQAKTSLSSMKAVHLLGAEEVRSMFSDVTEGLAFLHEKSILHLDLKPGNVLLTWDQGKLIPRAMLSDFGTSQDMLNSRARSGNTGTLEYASPESLPSPQTGLLSQMDSKSDMWSLGMILHKMLFFNLPYTYAFDGDGGSAHGERDKMDRLEKEVLNYPGFKSTANLEATLKARRLPKNFLVLLENLLCVSSIQRPSCERVLSGIREGRLDPLSPDRSSNSDHTTRTLIPVSLRGKVDHPFSPSTTSDLHERPSDKVMSRSSPERPSPKDRKASLSSSPISTLPPPFPTVGKPEKKVSVYDDDSRNGAWSWSVSLIGGKVVRIRIPKAIGMRSFKSLVLIVKVSTIPTICFTGQNIHPFILSLMLGLAIIDTWFDGLKVSVVLALMHALLIRLGTAVCGRPT